MYWRWQPASISGLFRFNRLVLPWPWFIQHFRMKIIFNLSDFSVAIPVFDYTFSFRSSFRFDFDWWRLTHNELIHSQMANESSWYSMISVISSHRIKPHRIQWNHLALIWMTFKVVGNHSQAIFQRAFADDASRSTEQAIRLSEFFYFSFALGESIVNQKIICKWNVQVFFFSFSL